MCQRAENHIDDCRFFLAESLHDRKEFTKNKKLCFACLNAGHTSQLCKFRKTCKKRHPTSFHGDFPIAQNVMDKSVSANYEASPANENPVVIEPTVTALSNI